ncbi:rrf2 family transcriptional regulator [Fructilactobacillus lindneri DSM 20690 = JCM 11027]|uniref:Rrf2 family transcriptional regulator n=1 Tax=Fructilactobacillus lindneri DSM 20690 = JCM 11027 TaxID=1122148 RepID=A0A0R2JSF1_9LACO|nr:rrf2 family transcriptional regulator [Fructilactobacillus lindneri DSM 20690 = JCM 11027]
MEILFYIELKTKMGAETYLTIQQIAETLNIPIPSVKRLVGMLKKANLIDSKKGTKGGLALAKAADEIRFYDVFEAIEGSTALFKMYDDFNPESFNHQSEAKYMLNQIKAILNTTEKQMLNELKQKTLADLFNH